MRELKRLGTAALRACAALLFMRGACAGAAVLLVLLARPVQGALALAAMGLAAALARCGPERDPTTALVNATLVGLGVAAMGVPLAAACGLVVVGVALVVPLTLVLDEGQRRGGGSALSLPFTLVTWALLLAMHPASPASATSAAWSTGSAWLDAFAGDFGAVLYRHEAFAGLLLGLVVATHSRVLALSAVVGHLGGCLARWLWSPSWTDACTAGDGFNSTLAGMAVGAALLVPGQTALALAALAGAGAAVVAHSLTAALAPLGLPALTAPLGVVALLAVRGAVHLAPALLPVVCEATPEATLAHHAALRRRLRGRGWDIALPVLGRWSVWQGEDGPWTHQGPWRHAIDLVLRDQDGHLHAGEGRELADWHAFGKPVLSPVDGTVVAVVDGVPDNAIGRLDTERNWGNLAVIADARGFHVELSHLRCGSLRVAVGQWVRRGQAIAECGNSGYSPQPHLHVQVQASPRVGEPTIPFRFGVHRRDGELVLDGLPPVGAAVEALPADPGLAHALDLVPGTRLRFRAGRDRSPAETVEFRVGRAIDGSPTLERGDGRLILGQHAGSWRIWRCEGDDPWLGLLHRALPSLPLCRLDGVSWHDHLPITAVVPGWRGRALAALGLALPEQASVWATLLVADGEHVRCIIPAGFLRAARRYEVLIDDQVGIAAVHGDGLYLMRIAEKPAAKPLLLAS